MSFIILEFLPPIITILRPILVIVVASRVEGIQPSLLLSTVQYIFIFSGSGSWIRFLVVSYSSACISSVESAHVILLPPREANFLILNEAFALLGPLIVVDALQEEALYFRSAVKVLNSLLLTRKMFLASFGLPTSSINDICVARKSRVCGLTLLVSSC